MTDIKPNARALMDEVKREHPTLSDYTLAVFAAQRAIERHEAFKQEVSDAVEELAEFVKDNPVHLAEYLAIRFHSLIAPKPKPDPLVEVLTEIDHAAMWVDKCAEEIRAALGERGWEIREKGQ